MPAIGREATNDEVGNPPEAASRFYTSSRSLMDPIEQVARSLAACASASTPASCARAYPVESVGLNL